MRYLVEAVGQMTRVAFPVALDLANIIAPQFAEVDTLIACARNALFIASCSEVVVTVLDVEHKVSILLVADTRPP